MHLNSVSRMTVHNRSICIKDKASGNG